MKRSKVMLVAVAMVGFLFAVSALAATDANKPVKGKQITVTGTVKVTKEKSGALKKVRLEEGKHIYWLVLDTNGQAIGNTLDGKQVTVTGILTMKDHDHWLTVETYTAK